MPTPRQTGDAISTAFSLEKLFVFTDCLSSWEKACLAVLIITCFAWSGCSSPDDSVDDKSLSPVESADTEPQADKQTDTPNSLDSNAPNDDSETASTDEANAAAQPTPEELVSFRPLPADAEERVLFLRKEISETVESLIGDFPGKANPLSLRALVHSRFNRPDLASEVWQECLELDPQFASAHTALGTIALENSELEAAEKHLRLAFETQPEHGQTRTSLAECLIKQNRAQEAIDLLTSKSASASPALIDLYHLGQAHAKLKEFETAVDYFRRAIDLSPNLTYAYYGLGTAYRRLGKTEEAKQALQKFQKLKQADLKSQKELTQTADDESGLRKTAAHVHFITGEVYSKAGKLATAVAHWIRSAKLDPLEVRARENLAQVFMQTGDFQQVIVILNELLRIEKSNPNHLMNLGMTYARLGQLDAAQNQFMKAIELSPDSSDAMMATAEFLILNRRDLDQARQLAERGTAITKSAPNYRILAMACVSTQDFAAALGAVDQGLALEPNNPEFRSLKLQLEAKLEYDKQQK